MDKFDTAIIGGGPGGYVAAIRASQLGNKVALIEEKDLGGTCLNRGCIPSKTLLRNAEVLKQIHNSEEFGIETGVVDFSYSKMLKRKDNVLSQLRMGISSLMKKGKIKVFQGKGTAHPDHHVTIEGEKGKNLISAKNIIIATGSSPIVPPIDGIEESGYYTSDTIYNMTELPKSIAIVGGGVIGVEYACIFASLGVDVTIVEMAERIIPQEDSDAAEVLFHSLKDLNVKVLTETSLQRVSNHEKSYQLELTNPNSDRKTLNIDEILVSTGRKPNLSAVKELQMEMKGSFVKVNDKMQTSVNGVYAVGDLIGGWQLAHAASAEGIIAAEHASGYKSKMNTSLIPRCIYTQPEIASVGLSEIEAEENGYQYKVTKMPLNGNGKAMAMKESKGFVKLIADNKYGEILGVTMVGPHVTEMITEPSAFIHLEGTVEEWANMVHPHPTLSESLFEAASSWLNKGIHS